MEVDVNVKSKCFLGFCLSPLIKFTVKGSDDMISVVRVKIEVNKWTK